MRKHNRARMIFTLPDVLSYGEKNGKVNLDHIESFLKEVKEEGGDILLGNFPSEISPRKLSLNPQAAKLLKKYITNRPVIVGGQSGSESVLKKMGRDHSVEDVEASASILKEAGFLPIVDILFGMPGESKTDRAATIGLIKKLIKLYDAKFNIHYMMALPGTAIYGQKTEEIENDIKEEVYKLIKHGIARGDFFQQLEYKGNL
jgi:radical SAM superfamily enzyme YgiQ (UPF0313 family)